MTRRSPFRRVKILYDTGLNFWVAAIYLPMVWRSSYCCFVDDSFSMRATARHTVYVRERRNLKCRQDLNCDVSHVKRSQKKHCRQPNEAVEGDAVRQHISVICVSQYKHSERCRKKTFVVFKRPDSAVIIAV